jgi:hypothetical protein
VLPELIGAIAATQDANFAARLVPRDEVFGAIVLGEGEVSTVSPHPLWVVAALALETVEAIEAGLSAAQQVSDFCYGSWTTALINHFVQKTDVKLHVTEIKTLGCSQGYWKNHTELWDSAIAAGVIWRQRTIPAMSSIPFSGTVQTARQA